MPIHDQAYKRLKLSDVLAHICIDYIKLWTTPSVNQGKKSPYPVPCSQLHLLQNPGKEAPLVTWAHEQPYSGILLPYKITTLYFQKWELLNKWYHYAKHKMLQKKKDTIKTQLHFSKNCVTCSLPWRSGVVDGINVMFVQVGFQKGYREGTSKGS